MESAPTDDTQRIVTSVTIDELISALNSDTAVDGRIEERPLNYSGGIDPEYMDKLERICTKDASNDQQCIICLEKFGSEDPNPESEVIITQCKHNFHTECISQWFEKNADCPVCRMKFPKNDDILKDLEKVLAQRQRELMDLIG
uniref:RING-type domain-containing protein n=1 Tax=Parastrongyloides trichosuri TaxID=131310 RepID=A0A0N4ZAH7_PARTI